MLNNTLGKNISDETRRKVLHAARDLEFVPNEKARDVAMIKHHSVGFFIPRAGYISSDAYIIRVIEGMTPVLNKNRFKLVLQPLKLQEMDYLSRARQDGLDGIILMNAHDDDKGLVELIAARFPLVVIGKISHPGVFQIDIDNRSAAKGAVQYLMSLGHRDIGMILHAPGSCYSARDRFEGTALQWKASGAPFKSRGSEMPTRRKRADTRQWLKSSKGRSGRRRCLEALCWCMELVTAFITVLEAVQDFFQPCPGS